MDHIITSILVDARSCYAMTVTGLSIPRHQHWKLFVYVYVTSSLACASLLPAPAESVIVTRYRSSWDAVGRADE